MGFEFVIRLRSVRQLAVQELDIHTVVIDGATEGQRLDRFLKKYLRGAPLSFIYKLIRTGATVNGSRENAGRMLKAGDEVAIRVPGRQLEEFRSAGRKPAKPRQFGIAYEDENVLWAEKPYGLLTHGDSHEKKNTLANQVIAYLIGKGGYDPERDATFTPSPVGRLDRNTSGLVLFGKNGKALRDLNTMFRHSGDVDKYYLAMVRGDMREALSLRSRMLKDEERNMVSLLPEESEEGRLMITEARPLGTGSGYTLAEVKLVTGRPHQIRAHLAEAGYPVVGDTKYGDRAANDKIARRFGLESQFLHAWRMKVNNGAGSLEYLSGLSVASGIPARLMEVIGGLIPGWQPPEIR